MQVRGRRIRIEDLESGLMRGRSSVKDRITTVLKNGLVWQSIGKYRV